MSRARILVAEDDEHIRDGLVDLLEGEGYDVASAADGRAALDAWQASSPDLVVLDVMMPERSGFDVCREIRKGDARTAILMLTAKGEEIDRVVGLELGADDYVSKPFGVRELLARVNALLRRSQGAKPVSSSQAETFPFGYARINRETLRGELDGNLFDLTPRELGLLDYLQARPGAAVRRDDLLSSVWGYEFGGTTRTVDQHIAQLRKKVERDPHAPAFLTTVHGLGYRYEGDPDD